MNRRFKKKFQDMIWDKIHHKICMKDKRRKIMRGDREEGMPVDVILLYLPPTTKEMFKTHREYIKFFTS